MVNSFISQARKINLRFDHFHANFKRNSRKMFCIRNAVKNEKNQRKAKIQRL